MRVELLLQEFQRLADAPVAIQRLRRFVLDLAVRGKLVDQKEADEPAQKLLARIAAIKAGQLVSKRRGDLSTSSGHSEPALDIIPDNWAWSTLESVGFINPRNEAPDDQLASFVPMPYVSADYGVPVGQDVRRWGDIKRGYTHFAEGDVGLAKITPCFENGKSTVFRNLKGGIGAGTTELHIVRPILVDPDYLLIFLKSPRFIATGIARMTGTAGQQRISSEYFATAPLPVPPLAEQSRIVSKVAELMALCDQLEAAQKGQEAWQDRLRAASLQRLTSSDNDGTARAANTQFFLRHTARLMTRPEHVAAVRQTVLDLAVRGRLVPQDPRDEPAADLLRRIATKRDEMLAQEYPNRAEARTQRKKQSLQVVSPLHPNLPPGWQWATLMQCSALIVDCRNKTVPYTSSGITLLRTTNVRSGQIVLLDHRYVSEETYLKWSSRYQPQPGDIVITREAPMGEAAKIPSGLKVCLGQRLMLARLVEETIDADFLVYSLRDSALMERVQDKPIGALVEHLRVGGIETLLVPLPPLMEQRRIVAKVIEMMALCDELEAALASGQHASGQLLEALLRGRLVGAARPEVLAAGAA